MKVQINLSYDDDEDYDTSKSKGTPIEGAQWMITTRMDAGQPVNKKYELSLATFQ